MAEVDAFRLRRSPGDSTDDAMSGAFNRLFRAELIRNAATRPSGGWKSVSDFGIALAEYVDCFNHGRLRGEIEHVPLAEQCEHGRPARARRADCRSGDGRLFAGFSLATGTALA